MSTYSKYADKYKARLRTRSSDIPAQSSFSQPPLQPLLSFNHRSTEPSPTRVQTLTPPRKTVDRNAYMSYLEVQLDKVSSACLTVQGFSERIQQVQSQINTHEDKLINMARLLKLQQTYSNGQEEEIRQLQDQVAQHAAKFNGTSSQKKPTPAPKLKGERNSSGERENKENKMLEGLLKRIEQLENKQMHQSIRKPLAPVVSGKEQAIQIQNMLWREDMERKLNEALSTQGRDMSRDVSILEERVATLQKELSVLRGEKEREQNRSELKELRISMSRDHPFQSGNESKQSDIQSAVNKWAEGVEIQVNKIQGKVQEMRREALMINQKVNEEIQDRRGKEEELKQRTEAAEQLCNRLVDDSLKKAAGLEGRLSKVESSMLHKLRRAEQRDESAEERRSVSKSPASGISASRLKEELKRVEELLTRKITNAVEKLGTLMKRYVKDQKRLVEKVDTMDSTMTTIPIGKKSKETTLKTIDQRKPKSIKSSKVGTESSGPKRRAETVQKSRETLMRRMPSEQSEEMNNFSSMENEDEEEKEVNYSPSIELFDTRSPYLKEKQRLSRESIQEERQDASLEEIRSSFQNKKTKKAKGEKSTPPPHRRQGSREKQRVRKSSEMSDISMKDKKAKKMKMKGEIKHTNAKSKSPSMGRRENVESSASPFRREKYRPESAKHSQKGSKFNFSPYQTERSKAQELSMRIKKERKTREKLMEDIKDFQKEVKGKNRHSAAKVEIDQDTVRPHKWQPKFKDAYEVKKRVGKDAVMEKLNKKLRQLQHL